jgi:ATP-dependent RNA helicase SUPV3L1/SUV3
MMADPGRGWAWTKALLGVPAAEIHVCGDYSVLHLVKNMCETMKCPIEVHEYERMTSLTIDKEGLGPEGYANVRAGDCVVAFSRRDIYTIKAAIEEQTDHKAAVIYGALPPETRRAQARLFNDPDSDWKVHIGMAHNDIQYYGLQ